MLGMRAQTYSTQFINMGRSKVVQIRVTGRRRDGDGKLACLTYLRVYLHQKYNCVLNFFRGTRLVRSIRCVVNFVVFNLYTNEQNWQLNFVHSFLYIVFCNIEVQLFIKCMQTYHGTYNKALTFVWLSVCLFRIIFDRFWRDFRVINSCQGLK